MVNSVLSLCPNLSASIGFTTYLSSLYGEWCHLAYGQVFVLGLSHGRMLRQPLGSCLLG